MSLAAQQCIVNDDPENFVFNPAHTTVEVGEARKRFRCNRGSLFDVSIYFKICLHSGFRETINNLVVLEKTTVEVFQRFLGWLSMRQGGFLSKEEHETVRSGTWTERTGLHDILLDVYAFAEHFIIRELAIDAMVILHKVLRNKPPPIQTLLRAFEIAHEDSPLCRYLTYAYSGLYSFRNIVPAQSFGLPAQVLEEFPEVFLSKVPHKTGRKTRVTNKAKLIGILGIQAEEVQNDEEPWWMMTIYQAQGYSWEKMSYLE